MSSQMIEVSIQTTNPALRASLREPTVKAFKASPRGLIAAIKYAEAYRDSLESAQGNLSRPVVKMLVCGKSVSFRDVTDDLSGSVYDGTGVVASATKVLRGLGC